MAIRADVIAAAVGIVVASGGAIYAWGGLSAEVNELRQRTAQLERRADETSKDSVAVIQRLATVESKIDGIRDLLQRDATAGPRR